MRLNDRLARVARLGAETPRQKHRAKLDFVVSVMKVDGLE